MPLDSFIGRGSYSGSLPWTCYMPLRCYCSDLPVLCLLPRVYLSFWMSREDDLRVYMVYMVSVDAYLPAIAESMLLGGKR